MKPEAVAGPAYDPKNIFARILRGEVPCEPVYVDPYAYAFADIDPLAPVHLLVVPQGQYVSLADFTAKASDAEIAGLMRAVGRVAANAGLDETGYRVLANHGADSHQEVPHLHFHIVGGAPLGRLLSSR